MNEWLAELGKVALGGALSVIIMVGGLRAYVKVLVTEIRILRRQMIKVLRRLERHDVRIKVLEGDGPHYERAVDGFAEGPSGPDN